MRQHLHFAAAVSAALALFAWWLPAPAVALTGEVTEFTVPAPPSGIATGGDGNIWFTMPSTNLIGRLNPTTGAIATFPAPGGLTHLAAAADGLWASAPGSLVRFSTTGTQTAGVPVASPGHIARSGDGSLWVAQANFGSTLYRIVNGSLAATVSYSCVGASVNARVAAFGDGFVWVTTGSSVLKLNANGPCNGSPPGTGQGNQVISLPGAAGLVRNGSSLAVTSRTAGTVATVSPASGAVSGTTGTFANASELTVDGTGALWVGRSGGSPAVGRVATSAAITPYLLPTSYGAASTLGSDGNVWFAEPAANKLARVRTSTETQTESLTVEGGVLSIARAQAAVTLGTIVQNQTTGQIAIGDLTYENTLSDGLDWSVTVAATDLVSGTPASCTPEDGCIPFTAQTFTPGTSIVPGGPSNATGGTFGGTDPIPGTSFSGPLTVATATATVQGSFTHSGSTTAVSVPGTAKPANDYVGVLQYTITG